MGTKFQIINEQAVPRIHWIRYIMTSLIRIFKNIRIRIQGEKYRPEPKMLILKHKLKLLTNKILPIYEQKKCEKKKKYV